MFGEPLGNRVQVPRSAHSGEHHQNWARRTCSPASVSSSVAGRSGSGTWPSSARAVPCICRAAAMAGNTLLRGGSSRGVKRASPAPAPHPASRPMRHRARAAPLPAACANPESARFRCTARCGKNPRGSTRRHRKGSFSPRPGGHARLRHGRGWRRGRCSPGARPNAPAPRRPPRRTRIRHRRCSASTAS